MTTPVLADNVTVFTLDLRSSQWQYDRNADGIVGWAELDQAPAPVGNQNGSPDGAELARIDSVVIAVSVRRDGRRQDYRTQVDFRNRQPLLMGNQMASRAPARATSDSARPPTVARP